MTPRKGFTDLQRLKIFEAAAGICHLCGTKIQGHAGERWEVEHIIPLAMLGTNDPDNLAPAHVACHATKSKRDAGVKAKTDRMRAKHIGAHKPSAWQSRWKRKINGTTVLREPT